MLDQINLHEHPTLADLGPWYFASADFVLQRNGVNLEETGSFLQG
jgi:hypothetical protein